ncbi:MAG: tetratricopeptide repeat protein [Steroidobacteraceae bacterium]
MSADDHESGVVPTDGAGGVAASEERLGAAMCEHQAGRVVEAERAYRALLAEHPGDANVAHYLGMLRFQVGEVDEGFALVRRSIEAGPANPHYWNNLGNMYVQTQCDQEAEEAYLRATSFDPRLAAAWYNLGRIYIRERKFERAIEAVRTVTRLRAGSSYALQTLAHLYYRLGRPDEARGVYEQWAEEAPDDPTPRHMLAAVSGRGVPDRADDRYIVKTFDSFADSFDQKLALLGYSAPALAAASLIEHPLYQTGRASILDAGCGTGWCGPLLQSTAGRLVGIDLSPGMLAQARVRGVYDELHEAELTAFMVSRPATFDIIVSTDVLCYFGRLDDAIRAAHDALLAGGLLCISVEALGEAAAGECFRLGAHGRYAHARPYLEHVMADAGFEVPRIDAAVLRQELGRPVHGYLVVGRRAAA